MRWIHYIISCEVVLLGLILGSFIALASYRLVRGQSVVFPRSRCPGCQKTITWYDNIPVLSFILLKQKCRYCQAKISWRYPAIEILTGFITYVAWLQLQPWPRFLLYLFCFILPLLILMICDWENYLLPDWITIPGIFLGLVVRSVDAAFWSPPLHATTPWLIGLRDGAIGAAVGFVFFLLIAMLFQRLRNKEGLGGGDVKMAAMLGAFLGWMDLFLVFFLASTLGSLFGLLLILLKRFSRETPLPFGVFLGGTSIVFVLFQREIQGLMVYWLR